MQYNAFSNKRSLVINPDSVRSGDTLFIARQSIDPVSFFIENVDTSFYTLYALQGFMVWKKPPNTASTTINYRLLGLDFASAYAHKKLESVDSNIASPMFSLSGAQYQSLKGFVDFNAIDCHGAYSRSFSVGNSQDVGLNSNFNLQLNGYIMDSIRIEAAITDNTIPFQPEGNTYQVQEFDRLYITFEKNKHKLTAGDFNILTPDKSYFLQFNKRVQGLWLQSEQKLHPKITNKLSFNGSIAKGQFARNIFNALEGNQGPYKLTGNNGEQFFIVLAGTERVFIDGILMERGEDRDYVINYNTAEVKFMPRQMITKDKRIQIEFEYQDRNYLNSLFHLHDELQIGKKWNVRINAYSNQDAKNQPYIASFSDAQKQFLASIGDNIQEAFYRSLALDTGGVNQIRYRITQQVVDGLVYDSVFVFSNNTDSALYQVNFSFIGEGKGNYIISTLNTNGRSYQWVPPVNGQPQGQYEPVVLLITPKKHQLFSVATTYQIDSTQTILIEGAASNYDPNLYASIRQTEHWGGAAKLLYTGKNFLGKKDSLGTRAFVWNNMVNYEYVHKAFKAIAPYRNIEFNRDWNVDTTRSRQDEHLVSFETGINFKSKLGLKYNLTYYKNGDYFNAIRNIATLDGQHKGFKASFTFNNMNAEGDVTKTAFFRPKMVLEKNFEKLLKLTLGTSYELEENTVRNIANNSLSAAAFKFDVWSVYLKNEDVSKTRIQLRYFTRTDYYNNIDRFTLDNQSQNIEAKVGFYNWEHHQINFTGGYRMLNIFNTQNTTLQPEESVVGRLEYQGNMIKRLLTTNVMYEIGTGQEQRREYVYVEVDAGMGMYMWQDYNGDGIQQANEFEIALFPDQKRYIRTLMLTNDYMKVDYANMSFSLAIQPDNLLGPQQKGFKKFINRFSNQLNIQINNRYMQGLGLQSFNVAYKNVDSNQILSQQQSIINTFYFNRASTVFGLDYIYTLNTGKSLLTYGLEGNTNTQHLAKARWGIGKRYTLGLKGILGNRSYQSGLDDNRTFDIQILGLEPSITAMFNSRLRVTVSYNNESRTNNPQLGTEKARINAGVVDLRWSMKKTGVLQTKLTYADIRYNGEANTSIAYNMLDALARGSNLLWNIGWNARIAKGIELSLEYEGRKPGDNPIIHTGRMSVRALL